MVNLRLQWQEGAGLKGKSRDSNRRVQNMRLITLYYIDFSDTLACVYP